MLRLSTFFTRKKIAEAVAAPSAPDALSAESQTSPQPIHSPLGRLRTRATI